MAGQKIFSLILVLCLAHSICAKSLPYTSEEIEQAINEIKQDATATDNLLIFTVQNFVQIPKKHASKVAEVSRQILKNEYLDQDKTEVKDFKQKLTSLVEKYDENKSDLEVVYTTMDTFDGIINYYYNLPQEKSTTETKFIVDLLNKFDSKNITIKLETHLNSFFENFIKMFEENKKQIEKPILDWYEQFMTIKDLKEKLKSIILFKDIAKKLDEEKEEVEE